MHKCRIRWCVVLLILAGCVAFSSTARPRAFPQQTGAREQALDAGLAARLQALQQEVKQAQGAGDNAWVLASTALVLLMTGPGLALFYGGLVRKKNVLGTMMQSFILMALITVLWGLVSYSLCFHEGNGVIGSLGYCLLHHVGAAPNASYAATIPQESFMAFQLMFAIITPALITGAFAERMKFSALVVFMILWSIFVYDPMGAYGLGAGRVSERHIGWRDPDAGFCRRDGCSYYFRGVGPGLRLVPRQARRLSYRAHAASQPGPEFHRRMPALGGMVRLQCWKRFVGRKPCDERFRGYSVRRGRGGAGLGGSRMGS
jgi:hypothetical protein